MTIDLTVPSLDGLHRRSSEKWSIHAPDVLSSTIAEMDFPIAEPVARALRGAIDRHDLGYAAPASAPLREAFAAFAARRLSWTVDPEQVSLVPDVMLGLLDLCRAIAEPGDAIAFASPAYPPFFKLLPRTGVQLIEVALDGDGRLDTGSLDTVLAAGIRALVLASPHNPTGHVSTVAGLKSALAVTASDRGRELVARVGPQHDHSGLLGAIAAQAAFADGDEWLEAVLAQLDANRAWLASELPARLPGVVWRPPQATYLAWLDCSGLGLGDEPADVFLRRGRIALGRGLDYGPGGAGHVRLNFATSPEQLDDALARMRTALDSG